MNRVIDWLRLTLVSPELIGFLLPLVGYSYEPLWMDVLVKPMKDSIGFGIGAVAIPLGMLAFNYKECFDMLSLTGKRKVLIEWPDYGALKRRVLAAFGWCVGGSLCCILAVWLIATDHLPQLGVAIMLGGLLAASASTATIGLARFALREILGE